MNHGLEAVREVVGSAKETGIPDSAIREALWEYYFDVAQTIDWVYGTFKSPFSSRTIPERLCLEEQARLTAKQQKGQSNSCTLLLSSPFSQLFDT
jgi:hypothetical protein